MKEDKADLKENNNLKSEDDFNNNLKEDERDKDLNDFNKSKNKGLKEDDSLNINRIFKSLIILKCLNNISFKKGFKDKTIFKKLSDIIDYIKGFLSEAGIRVRIRIIIRVFKTVEIIRILEIVNVIINIIKMKIIKSVDLKALSFYIKYNIIILWLKWLKYLIKLFKRRTTNRIIKKNNKKSLIIIALLFYS